MCFVSLEFQIGFCEHCHGTIRMPESPLILSEHWRSSLPEILEFCSSSEKNDIARRALRGAHHRAESWFFDVFFL